MFLYPSIIMEVGQDKGPWKTIFWLEPDLNSIHVCWIQGVCPPQEIQCHTTTQSWRMPHNNTQHPSREVKSLMCGHQKNQKHQHPITICQRLESKSHPDGDYENCRPVVPQPLQGRTSKAATWAFGATVEFGSQWSPWAERISLNVAVTSDVSQWFRLQESLFLCNFSSYNVLFKFGCALKPTLVCTLSSWRNSWFPSSRQTP